MLMQTGINLLRFLHSILIIYFYHLPSSLLTPEELNMGNLQQNDNAHDNLERLPDL